MIKFSENAMAVINSATELAANTGGIVYTEHLLMGMLSVGGTQARRILDVSGIFGQDVLGAFSMSAPCISVEMSPRAKVAMSLARQVAMELKSDAVHTEHLLYAVLDDPTSYCCRIISSLGMDPEHVQRLAYNAMVEGGGNSMRCAAGNDMGGGAREFGAYGGSSQERYGEERYSEERYRVKPKQEALSDGGELAKFGTDMTLKARQGKLDPVIGREKETQRVIQVLCRRTKNNPVLVGEPGVGKSAIIDGLAIAIAEGNVPEPLKDKTVFSLDLSALVAGTRYRGDFEERLKSTLKLIKQRGDIILFIDEIHTILKAGASEGGLDIANILKPMLARGELTTIGATTFEEYKKQFEQDSALERRFQPVIVNEPSVTDTIAILGGLKGKYEAHHGVAITDEAIAAAAVLSDRYVRDRFLPDKAVDLIDEAAACKRLETKDIPESVRGVQNELSEARKALKQAEEEGGESRITRLKEAIKSLSEKLSALCAENDIAIGADDVAKVVSDWTGIPVSKMSDGESERLEQLDKTLKSRVIGQDKACEVVARAVRRARAGLKDPKRPIGSFLFMGPTGVGKTELAKALAEALFGDEDMLIRIDMSEYMDKGSASRLIGAAPGLVGFEEGGQLTEKVRRKPYCVVLFDEIEKGHEDIYNLLLQVLEDGILTDGKGKTVSFKNAVIILTSNVGAREAAAKPRATGFGAEADDGERRAKYMQALKDFMKPEIINRLDEVVVFESLSKEDMLKIADIMFASLNERLAEKGVRLKLSEAAKQFVVSQGFDSEYGARPLRRAVQRLLEDRLSEEILSGRFAPGDVVVVDYSPASSSLTFE